MKKPVFLLPVFCLLLLFGLAACDESAPLADEAPSPWLAIARGYVSVEGGLINIDATRPGIIRQVLAEEGMQVKQGQLLAQLEDDEARQALNIARSEQQQALRDSDWTAQQLAIARREYQRTAAMPRDSVAAQQKDQAKDQVDLLIKQRALKSAVVATANAKVAAATLEVEKYQVRAPLNGRIVKRQASPGEGASTLNVTHLFTLAPDTQRIVRAELEDIFVDAVRPGMRAEVITENEENGRYFARVTRLGEVFGAQSESDDPSVKQDNRVIELVLALDDAASLRLGQRVLVKIFSGEEPPDDQRDQPSGQR